MKLSPSALSVAFAGLLLACSDPAAPPARAATGGSAGAGQSSGAGGAATGGGAGGSGGSGGLAGGAGTGGAGETGGAGGSSAGAAGAGTGGVGGSGGAGGANPAAPSAGCHLPAAHALASWFEKPTLPVNGNDRQWWVWLPDGYDPARAYPLVFTLHGCGGPDNFIPMQEQTGSDAIVVRGTGADDGCWTYGGEGDDVQFFDAMLAALEAEYCVDTSRVFSMGYSSGAWMTNTLECTRGDKLRATGTLSGGRVGNLGECKGKFARATVHDLDDTTNPFDEQGAAEELDRVLAQNGCTAELAPVAEDPEPCARYQGCDEGFPVIACFTEGQGHDRQDELAMDAFWRLFSSL